MDKVMNAILALTVLSVLAIGLNAFRDLNDGRILTVVQQLVAPQALQSQAAVLKRNQ